MRFLTIGLLLVAGCGTTAFQREVLVALLGQANLPEDGEDGAAGLACYDYNANGECDEDEDWNGPDGIPDSICDAWDCQGVQGVQGEPGEDSTVPGPAGPPGADSTVPGPPGADAEDDDEEDDDGPPFGNGPPDEHPGHGHGHGHD